MINIKRQHTLLALTILFSSHAVAETVHVPLIYKFIGAGVVATGAAHALGKCKHGTENSIETDPITGIGKPTKVCASAPDGYWSDYSNLELAAVMLAENKLKENMKEAGEPSRDGCAAHHIVPKAQKDKYNYNRESRKIIDDCAIGIHDAINGVNLPYRSDAECVGSRHNNLHSGGYFEAVYITLLNGFDANKCDGVKDALKALKEDLTSGRLGPNGY